MRARHVAAFSFDIEDWYHSQLLPPDRRHSHGESVVERGTLQILEWLERHGARGTFFVLGDVVERHPDLVRRMIAGGHELGCHGFDHTPLWQLDRESFRAQLRAFRAAVVGALGDFPVRGFRAPTFSLDRTTAWALEVLAEEGYAYDSSVFPARVRMYGVPDAPVGIWRPSAADLARHDASAPLVEFPVAVCEWGPLRVPVGGGFYLRALPWTLVRASLDRILAHRPFALYLHPREVEPESKRLPLDPVDGFITYVNLHTVAAKLERLFERYAWTTMSDVLERESWLAPDDQRAGARRTSNVPTGTPL